MNTTKYSKVCNLSHSKFKRCTGVTKYVFEMLVLVVEDGLKCKNKSGRKHKLILEDRILMFLEYYREYRTFFHLGTDYGINETNVQRNIEKIEKIILESGYFRLQGNRVLSTDKSIKNIRIDVTESPAQRPKKK